MNSLRSEINFYDELVTEMNSRPDTIVVVQAEKGPQNLTFKEWGQGFIKDPITVVALIVSVVFGLLQWRIRRKIVKDNQFLKATEYFTGRTQNRSVGISMVEGLVSNRRYMEALFPLLYYQFVYLMIAANPVSKDKPTDKKGILKSRPHEEKNLIRIVDLLQSLWKKSNTKLRDKFKRDRQFWVSWILLNTEKRIALFGVDVHKDDYGIKRSYLNVDKTHLIEWKAFFERENTLEGSKIEVKVVEEGELFLYQLRSVSNREVFFISQEYESYELCRTEADQFRRILESKALYIVGNDKKDSRLFRFEIYDENKEFRFWSVRYTSKEQAERRVTFIEQANF